MKMKTLIIAAFIISSALIVCLQADARQLILEEAKRGRGETDVQPSLVPAKSAINGDGIMAADQVNTSREEKNESDEDGDGEGDGEGEGDGDGGDYEAQDEDKDGRGSSGESTHHVFPGQPPIHGH